jgi:hypothetical protein
MTNASQPKPAPTPTLLVYGKPTSADLPQASWFRIEDRPNVMAAAQSLKFSVLDIQTDAERALTIGVHEGVLKGNGRMIVGSVTPEVYKRIEEHAAKASAARVTTASSDKAAETKPAIEQNTNILGASSSRPTPPQVAAGKLASAASPNLAAAPISVSEAAAAPNPWETLTVGARVLAAYWNEDREFEGFWLATVKRIEKGEFTLEWFEAPEYPPFKSRPKNIAVPHPEFRPSGK